MSDNSDNVPLTKESKKQKYGIKIYHQSFFLLLFCYTKWVINTIENSQVIDQWPLNLNYHGNIVAVWIVK